MPNLRYQYIMNEPFVGGIKSAVQTSNQANVHKIRRAYDLDIVEPKMTHQEEKDKINKDLCNQINADMKSSGRHINYEDLNTFLIKKENQVEFGLHVLKRKYEKLPLFDFKIEECISI